MGGRKQKKKVNLDLLMKESYMSSNHSAPARNLTKTDLGGVIFGATHNTINECLSLQLFGLPGGHYSYIKNIREGLVLFLFNYSDRKLHGIFEAAGHGQMNINQYAWVADGDGTGYTRYPAQVKIRVRKLCHPLSEDQFQPIIADNYYESKHFYFELDNDQTKKLVSLFASSLMNSSISTKWSTLYASLPATSRKQEYNAHVSQGMTSPKYALPENLYQASKVSYASALGGTSNATTTASSSLPAGEWRALFKSEIGTQENTTRDELLFNKEYEDEGDFLQADTWEESHWATTNEAEHDQSWASDLNPQPNTTTDKADAMLGNSWEESQHISHVSQGMTNLTQALPENLYQTSKVSYASALCGTSDTTTIASSSQPAGEWSTLFKSEVGIQANTSRDELLVNQEYEDKGDFLLADTWEESHWATTYVTERDHSRESDLNPQANTATNKADVMLGNTWEESQHIAPTTCKVEHGQTSDMSDEHFTKPSSSHQPLDDNILVPNRVEAATNLQPLVAKLMQEFEVMKISLLNQSVKINMLEQKSDMSKLEIQQLRNQVRILEAGSNAYNLWMK